MSMTLDIELFTSNAFKDGMRMSEPDQNGTVKPSVHWG